MPKSKRRALNTILSPGRVEALTDGVFAIVMTLLVLELGVPLIAETSVHVELPHQLLEMWPKFASFGFSFIFLGFMWSQHHYHFVHIKRSDAILVWTNIIFLMFVSLLPFSTSLVAEYRIEQTAVLLYGVNCIACMIIRYAMWCYATGNHRLVEPDINLIMVRRTKLMLLMGITVFAVGIGISFVSALATVCLYLVMLIFVIIRSTLSNRITSVTQKAQ